MSHPFHGPGAPVLYDSEDRTRQRSDALLSAKTAGRNIGEVLCGFADNAGLPTGPTIIDVGCGQGRMSLRLARHFPSAEIIAVDAAPAMVAAARDRTVGANVRALVADFHALPFAADTFDLAVAVMCLYHSPTPHLAIAEIRRTLHTHGAAILVTKAADSYRELAELLAQAGLDPGATARPSLYETAHSGNLLDLAEQGGLHVERFEHEQHVFTFKDLAHTAEYLTTCPQYPLSDRLRRPDELAVELRKRLPDGPVTTTAIITYVLARPAENVR